MATLCLFPFPWPMSSSITCSTSSPPLRFRHQLCSPRRFTSLAQLDKTHEHAEVPSLGSLLLPVPPLQPSVYMEEADQLLARRVDGWGMKPGVFDRWRRVGCSASSYAYCGCVGAHRLAAVAGHTSLLIFLDDMPVEREDVDIEAYGLDGNLYGDPASIEKFCLLLDSIFRSPVLPANRRPVERAYWEAGQGNCFNFMQTGC